MGQISGKASLSPEALVFANLPHKAIASLWQNFNDYADGFGITKSEFIEICADLREDLSCSAVAMKTLSEALFNAIDTDHNNLIDALEVLSMIAALSGLPPHDTMLFILSCYDFDGQQQLSVDEVTLALKSLTIGLCKISTVCIPKEKILEALVSNLYEEAKGREPQDDTLQIPVLATQLCRHPDVLSWFNSFASPTAPLPIIETVAEPDYKFESMTGQYSAKHLNHAKWTIGNANGPDPSALPWIDVAADMAPAQFAGQPIDETPPGTSLELAWIFGYESQRSRGNLHYTCHGRVAYPSGRYVVLFDMDSNKQQFFSAHTALVMCLASHPEGLLFASGDGETGSKLLVWDSSSLEIKFSSSLHQHGVAQVAFSRDGAFVAAVGCSELRCLSVHDWRSGDTLYTCLINEAKCLGIVFLKEESVVAVGENYVFVLARSSEGFIKRKGNFSANCPMQPITCVTRLIQAESFVSGTMSGDVYYWHDCNAVRRVKAHDGMVTSIYSNDLAVISGGIDRRIRLWTHRVEAGATFDVTGYGGNGSVRSLCLSKNNVSILVGTKGGDVHEISAIDGSDLRGGALTSGHYIGKIRGVSACSVRPEICTAGDDGTVRVWDLMTHALLKVAKFDAQIRCICYSPAADMIAIGMGDRVGLNASSEVFGRCGAYAVLSEPDLGVLHEARDSLCSISAIRISGDGETLATGAEDGTIYLYALLDQFEFIGKCIRHTAGIISIDFSSTGEFLRSNSSNGELHFFSSDDASNLASIAALRDIEWESNSCSLSWYTQYAHSTELSGEVITCSSLQTGGTSIAFGTDYGYIKSYKFPVANPDAKGIRFYAHCGSIAQIVHSFEDTFLVSVGEHDRSIAIWRILTTTNTLTKGNALPSETIYGYESLTSKQLESHLVTSNKVDPVSLLNGDPMIDETNLEIKDRLLSNVSTDSWLGSVVSPTAPQPQKKEVPTVSLQLEHVYGSSCLDMRNYARFTALGEIVYVAGGNCVVYDVTTQVQKFFRAHDDSISSFVSSDDGSLVATAQMGVHSKVIVWETCQCSVVNVLSEGFYGAVSAMAFSSDSRYLAIACVDENNTLSVYDWRHSVMLSRVYNGSSRVTALTFKASTNSLLVCTVDFIKMFEFQSNALNGGFPMYSASKVAIQGPFLCCVYTSVLAVVGALDGHLHTFSNMELVSSIKAHSGSVDCLYAHSISDVIVSGGRDGKILVWSSQMILLSDISCDSFLKCPVKGVCSVALNKDNSKLIVATNSGQIFQIKLPTTEKEDISQTFLRISEGHYMRDVRGLAAHPTKSIFATSGDDAMLRIYDAQTHSIMRSMRLDASSRAIAFSPNGKYLSVGYGCNKRDSSGVLHFKEGGFTVFQVSDMKKLHEGKDSSEAISVIKFSSNSKFMAIGSYDSKVYVYTVEDLFSIRTIITCHKAPMKHIDFSLDGSIVMSVDSTNKVYFSESTSGVFIPSTAALRDEKWGTWSNPYGWPVLGLWMTGAGKADISVVQKSTGGALVASGNARGLITIANFPCPERSGYLLEHAHNGNVGDVVWIAGDTHLISIGSADQMVMQWKCVYEASKELGDSSSKLNDVEDILSFGGVGYDDQSITRTSGSVGKVPLWRSSICPATAALNETFIMPQLSAKIDQIYGTRILDSQHSMRYNANGFPVTIGGKHGIIELQNQYKQNLYHGHSSAVICIDVTSHGMIAATGEVALLPQVHIWDACTGLSISKFCNIHRQGVTCVAFGKSGTTLVTLGQDPLHSVVLLRSPSGRWKDGFVEASMSCNQLKLMWALHVDDNSFPICVGGAAGMFFFRCNSAGTQKVAGVFGKDRIIQPLLCAVAGCSDPNQVESVILSGTMSGHIYEWKDQEVISSVVAHDMPVTAIARIGNIAYASAAGDGLVKVWFKNLKLQYIINCLTFIPVPLDLKCNMLIANIAANKLAIGLQSGEVYEVALQTKSSRVISQMHNKLQLHGLCCNPVNMDEFATAGDDGVVMVWSVSTKVCIRKLEVDAACRAIAWSPDGMRFVIGFGGNPSSTLKDGAFMICTASTLQVEFEDRKSKVAVSDVCWSTQDGLLFAVGSLEGKVYLHSSKTFELLRTISLIDMKTKIWKIEFSLNNAFIRISGSISDVYDANVSDGAVNQSPNTTKDTDWSTYSCPYNWLTQGVWRPAADGVEVLATAVCAERRIIAASYQNGDIRVYNFPCTDFGRPYVVIPGICSQASRIQFTADGAYLIAIDAFTRTILQYKIV